MTTWWLNNLMGECVFHSLAFPQWGCWQRPACYLNGKAVLSSEGPGFFQSFFPLEQSLKSLNFSSIRSSDPGQRGSNTKGQGMGSNTQLINIISILTNGRPESQTEQPLGHMAGVCPGALRTLSGWAQVPSIFLCAALAPTSRVNLLSGLGPGSQASQRRFIPQDWPTWMYVSKFTKTWVWWQATKGQRKSRQGV